MHAHCKRRSQRAIHSLACPDLPCPFQDFIFFPPSLGLIAFDFLIWISSPISIFPLLV